MSAADELVAIVRQNRILREVRRERERQDGTWGEQNHSPEVWLMILSEEIGEASREMLEAWVDETYPGTKHTPETRLAHLKEYRRELVQVAAVAIAMIESVDRNELREAEDG